MSIPDLKVGEKPDPFLHTFEDADGDPIPVDAAWFSVCYPDGTTDTEEGEVVDGDAGQVSYQLPEVTQPYMHVYEFWGTSGDERVASDTEMVNARPAVAVPE